MSSPPASPASSCNGESAFLTPRSKVAKMLADIDNEIDNAETPQQSPSKRNLSTTTNIIQSAECSAVGGRNIPRRETLLVEGENGDEDTEEDDDQIVHPRSRAAMRMLAKRETGSADKATRVVADNFRQLSPSPPSRTLRSTPSPSPEEDLYSATPIQSTRVGKGRLSDSPANSERSGGGLFVSPAKSVRSQEFDDDLPQHPFGGTQRFAELVAQKKAERLAKEADERRNRDTENASAKTPSEDLPEDIFQSPQDPVDENVERIMSDAARPTRKASKRALMEMERETQRLARQQALAHKLQVKKRFTTSDLLKKFGFRQSPDSGEAQEQVVESEASSAPNSDGIPHSDDSLPQSVRRLRNAETPPSSPPSPLDREREKVERGALRKLMPVREDTVGSVMEEDSDGDLPELKDMLSSSCPHEDAAKPIRSLIDLPDHATKQPQPLQPTNKRGLKLARWGKKARMSLPSTVNLGSDDEDDLEIEPPLPRHLKVFQNARGASKTAAADSSALHHLRHLASIGADSNAPSKKGKANARPAINSSALESVLRKRALLQAKQAQEDRLAELRAKGITVLSVEEREKEAEQFENLLEKARQDAADLRKAEKAAAKGLKTDVDGGLASDDESEDEDYEVSGSEEEDRGQNEDESNEIVDDAAEESDGEEDTDDGDDSANEESSIGEEEPDETIDKSVTSTPLAKASRMVRQSRKTHIVADDEDDIVNDAANKMTTPVQSRPATSIATEEEDPFAAFNFDAMQPGGLMSPTQAFNATMQTPTQLTQENSMDLFNHFAPPPSESGLSQGLMALGTPVESQVDEQLVPGSQVSASQRIDLGSVAPQTPAPASVRRDVSDLSAVETPGWEPTQDQGLPSPWTGIGRQSGVESVERSEHDTQSTVALRVSESPGPTTLQHEKRGRLVKRRPAVVSSDTDSEIDMSTMVKPKERDVFAEMAKRRRSALTAAERDEADREMRAMMDEQAEESEDEYAGLGGDDAIAPETAEDRAMIDSSQVEVDERALAAHFAERERLRQEQEVSKLYKDLTTGALRRRTGGAGAWELDDDEDEVAIRRRQMRQREEARKRKLLLQDEGLAGLAEGKPSKGKDAFLKAIADDVFSDNEEDVISDQEEDQQSMGGQQDSQSQERSLSQKVDGVDAPLHEISGNKRPRPTETESYERPPAKQRRVMAATESISKRPASLLEVRESVSFLLDEPPQPEIAAPTAWDSGDSSESSEDEFDGPLSQVEQEEEAAADLAEEESRQNDGGFASMALTDKTLMPPPPRPPASQRRTKAVDGRFVDRLSLKRNSSSASSNGSSGFKSAWGTTAATGGPRVPSLLRRATTGATSGANERGVTTSNASSLLSRANSAGLKLAGPGKAATGSGRSSLAYQARAEERRAIVEASARRRAENTQRIAQMRRSASDGGFARGLGGGIAKGFE